MMESVRRRLPLSSSPGWGTVGCPACRQLVRRRRASPPTSGCAAVRFRPGRPAAAGHVRAAARARRSSSASRKKTRADADTLCAKLRAAAAPARAAQSARLRPRPMC
jgi:hypothetical protein